jgi:hypothetical protein
MNDVERVQIIGLPASISHVTQLPHEKERTLYPSRCRYSTISGIAHWFIFIPLFLIASIVAALLWHVFSRLIASYPTSSAPTTHLHEIQKGEETHAVSLARRAVGATHCACEVTGGPECACARESGEEHG